MDFPGTVDPLYPINAWREQRDHAPFKTTWEANEWLKDFWRLEVDHLQIFFEMAYQKGARDASAMLASAYVSA